MRWDSYQTSVCSPLEPQEPATHSATTGSGQRESASTVCSFRNDQHPPGPSSYLRKADLRFVSETRMATLEMLLHLRDRQMESTDLGGKQKSRSPQLRQYAELFRAGASCRPVPTTDNLPVCCTAHQAIGDLRLARTCVDTALCEGETVELLKSVEEAAVLESCAAVTDTGPGEGVRDMSREEMCRCQKEQDRCVRMSRIGSIR